MLPACYKFICCKNCLKLPRYYGGKSKTMLSQQFKNIHPYQNKTKKPKQQKQQQKTPRISTIQKLSPTHFITEKSKCSFTFVIRSNLTKCLFCLRLCLCVCWGWYYNEIVSVCVGGWYYNQKRRRKEVQGWQPALCKTHCFLALWVFLLGILKIRENWHVHRKRGKS